MSRLKELKGELLFDEYTSGRFHEWIMCKTAAQVVAAGLYDQKLMEDALADMGLSQQEIQPYCNRKLKTKYYLKKRAPMVYGFLKEMKAVINRS